MQTGNNTMPTPVGHTLMGGICYTGIKSGKFKGSTFLLFIFLANLPDLDYLPGIFIGAPNAYHHAFTHSLGFSLIVGIAFGLFAKHTMHQNFWLSFLIVGSLSFSHAVLDYFAADTSLPYGVPIFWPFLSDYFISPFTVFTDVYKGSTNESFINGLKELHNWIAVLREILILLPIWGLVSLGRWFMDTKHINWQKYEAKQKKN